MSQVIQIIQDIMHFSWGKDFGQRWIFPKYVLVRNSQVGNAHPASPNICHVWLRRTSVRSVRIANNQWGD